MDRTFLVVIAERKALAWVLRSQRMAFPVRRTRQAADLRTGDELLLYTSRGCFHSPWQDRGRIIGRASVGDEVRLLEPPLDVAGVLCGSECDLVINSLVPFRTGLELGPLVQQLDAFPDARSWSARMRTTLLALSASDAALLRRGLRALEDDPAAHHAAYLDGARGPRERRPPTAAT